MATITAPGSARQARPAQVRRAPVRHSSAPLTRRGYVVAGILLAALVWGLFSLLAPSLDAADPSTPAPAGPVATSVVVQPGESLWAIAERVAPDADPRVTISRILEMNSLREAGQVQAGQQLLVPAS